MNKGLPQTLQLSAAPRFKYVDAQPNARFWHAAAKIFQTSGASKGFGDVSSVCKVDTLF